MDIPIIFSAPMVLALLAGRKTMTRRIPTPQWRKVVPGDRLWVRENFAKVPTSAYRRSEGVQQTVSPEDPDFAAIYAAGWDRSIPKWKPCIHMPRWASRLTLAVTATKIEPLQDISEEDAKAEGVEPIIDHGVGNRHLHRIAFEQLWERLHGAGSWLHPVEVVALTFAVHKINIDQFPSPPSERRG